MKHFRNNPRKISKAQIDRLKKTMQKYGDLSGITHILETDELITGNQRSDAGDFINQKPIIEQEFKPPLKDGTVAIGYFDMDGVRFNYRAVQGWTTEEQQEANLIANAAGGDWDWKMLETFPVDLLNSAGFDEDMLKGDKVNLKGLQSFVDSQEPAEAVDAAPQTDRAQELLEKWQVKTGDLWQIGEHRLICGDSTKAEDYKTLTQGETASMCFTSPPYNQGGKSFRLPAFYKGEGDNKTKDEYFDFLISVLECLNTNMTADAPLLWNVSYNSQSRDDYGRIVFSSSNPFHVMETIIWDKKHGFNISARGILSRDSELIFLMCSGEDYYTNQGRYDTWYNTWRIGTQGAQTEGHGAAYPVELVEKGINLFSPVDGIIIEPFCGTGTTLVACQNLGRRGRAVEISPAYVAVTLQRMSDAFPELEIKRL